jgi:molybdate transport system substrate-binding protein
MVSLQGSDLGKTVYPYDSVEAVLPPRFQNSAASVQDLTVPPVNNVYDLHGSPTEADLVVFFNGNQFMVVSELLQAFRQQQPSVKHIFYETLPPGVLVQQVKGRPLRIGNLMLTLRPDVITTEADEMHQLTEAKLVQRRVVYAENALAILVAAGNPLRIQGLADLARPEVRVAMPDPATEGVGRLIVKAFEQAGGPGLVAAIMEGKVAHGSTRLTSIHHRETALDILAGEADAGPLWLSQESIHCSGRLLMVCYRL